MSSGERENRYLDGWTKKGPAFFIQIDTCINQAQPRKLDEVEVSFIQAIWDSISFTCSSSIFYLLLTFLSPLENESIFEKKAHLDIPFHNRLDFDFLKRLYFGKFPRHQNTPLMLLVTFRRETLHIGGC